MFGEISKRRADGFQAFNGDNPPSLFIGELRPLAPNPDPTPPPNDYLNKVSFGSSHPGVVQFAMCDGSVQPISRDIDPGVLDRMATRAGDDLYELEGVAEPCPAPTVINPF
jgi:prepilin-type processing-associated H-X9-DG protein